MSQAEPFDGVQAKEVPDTNAYRVPTANITAEMAKNATAPSNSTSTLSLSLYFIMSSGVAYN